MTIWKKRFAVPAEHGTWAWWTVPFVIGLAAGGHPTWTILPLLVATVAAFFAHQPAQIAVKALSGRRPRSDLAPALVWLAIYAVPIALGSACLVATGYARVLGLALPGVLVFAWHLWLVAKKAERRQMAIEMLAAGVLALTAPAAYWVAGGDDYPEPWFLWAMTWIQAAASIANVYVRLEQKRWPLAPPLPVSTRIHASRWTLLLHVGGLGLAILLATTGRAPGGVVVAFAIPLADALSTVSHPMIGARPARIGIRQLIVAIAFAIAMSLAYLL